MVLPGNQPADYSGGRIEAIDIKSGEVETLYSECNGHALRGPNDIVFDASGGFWFTDHGKNRPRDKDRTGVYYAQADGSHIDEVIFPLEALNGIGLSPDENMLYVAETPTGRLWAFYIESPGKLTGARKMMAQIPNYHMFDSLAVDADGGICVATLITGGITIHSADGLNTEFVPMPDILTTNICFGGNELNTAYITLSSSGKLVSAVFVGYISARAKGEPQHLCSQFHDHRRHNGLMQNQSRPMYLDIAHVAGSHCHQ